MEDFAATSSPDRRRTARAYRVAEALGLVLLLIGLAAGAYATAVAGAAVILLSYGLYRRNHGAASASDPGPAGFGEEGSGD